MNDTCCEVWYETEEKHLCLVMYTRSDCGFDCIPLEVGGEMLKVAAVQPGETLLRCASGPTGCVPANVLKKLPTKNC